MTTGDRTVPEGGRSASPAKDEDNYLTHTRGLLSWLTTLDHKRIGVMYLVSILVAFFLGGMAAILVRTEHLTGTPTIMQADSYNKMFTFHGVAMVFLFIIPGIPAALGNFVLPIMLGAKDVAFPRLNLTSWYLWIGGALLAMLSLILGGVETGWTFYTPYSTTTKITSGVIPVVAGAFVLGFSSIFTGLNFIVTVHKLRPPGMGWFRLPLFVWGLYATALVQILATPVLGITLLLLIVERAFGYGIFDPALGGDPILFQHFFWFYSHPAVYIMILPGMGIMSELVSVFSRKHIFSYKFIAYSSIAIAVFGFLVWGHHMFTSGQSPAMSMIFSALTFSVAIPSAIKVFNWTATMYKGAITLKTPMLYALSFIFLFGIGGLTGLFLGSLVTNQYLHDSYFVVAHFHYVMFGGTVVAFLGGLHYWWPKMFGRLYSDRLGQLACLLMFVGVNVTFFSQFLLGSHGMPRRYFNYPAQFTPLHVLSTIGSYMLVASFLLIAYYLLDSLVRGKKAPDNPWGGATLEWQTTSPPPVENFKKTPIVGDPYDFSCLRYDPEIGGYIRIQEGAS